MQITPMTTNRIDNILAWMMVATLILISLAGILNAQMDLLKFNPGVVGATGWWKANNWQAPWWQKTLLSFTLDGWHFLKSLTFNIYFVILLCWANLAHTLFTGKQIKIRNVLYDLILFNIAHGVGFETSYKWFRI